MNLSVNVCDSENGTPHCGRWPLCTDEDKAYRKMKKQPGSGYVEQAIRIMNAPRNYFNLNIKILSNSYSATLKMLGQTRQPPKPTDNESHLHMVIS